MQWEHFHSVKDFWVRGITYWNFSCCLHLRLFSNFRRFGIDFLQLTDLQIHKVLLDWRLVLVQITLSSINAPVHVYKVNSYNRRHYKYIYRYIVFIQYILRAGLNIYVLLYYVCFKMPWTYHGLMNAYHYSCFKNIFYDNDVIYNEINMYFLHLKAYKIRDTIYLLRTCA